MSQSKTGYILQKSWENYDSIIACRWPEVDQWRWRPGLTTTRTSSNTSSLGTWGSASLVYSTSSQRRNVSGVIAYGFCCVLLSSIETNFCLHCYMIEICAVSVVTYCFKSICVSCVIWMGFFHGWLTLVLQPSIFVTTRFVAYHRFHRTSCSILVVSFVTLWFVKDSMYVNL